MAIINGTKVNENRKRNFADGNSVFKHIQTAFKTSYHDPINSFVGVKSERQGGSGAYYTFTQWALIEIYLIGSPIFRTIGLYDNTFGTFAIRSIYRIRAYDKQSTVWGNLLQIRIIHFCATAVGRHSKY